MAARGKGFRWEAPPTRIAVGAERYSEAVRDGIGEIGDVYAARMEGYAKANAPWQDRTGAARQGLTGKTEKGPAQVDVILYGDAEYLPYLELGTRSMQPLPIIWPTIAAHAAPLMADVRRLVED